MEPKQVVTAYVDDSQASFQMLDALDTRGIDYIQKTVTWSERARLEALTYEREIPFCVLFTLESFDTEGLIERIYEND